VSEIKITLPLQLRREQIDALRSDPRTACEDRDTMNLRIGWFLQAWEVLISHRLPPEDQP